MLTDKQPSLVLQTMWLMIARTLGFVFSFVLPLMLTRIFSTTELGIYRQAFLIVTTATNIVPLGMHVSAFYYLAGPPERRPGAMLNIFVFLVAAGVLVGGIIILFPQILGQFSAAQVARMSTLIGVLIVFWIVASFLEVVATANQDITWSTWFIIMSQVTKTTFVGGAALLFRSVDAVIYAALLQGILQTVVLVIYLTRSFPGIWRSLDPALLREQMSYAVPFGIATLMYTGQSDFHSYLVAASVPAASYAIYSIGTAQLPLVNLLRDSLNAVLISRISAMQQEDRIAEIRSLVFRSVRKVFTFYLPVWGALLLLGHELITAMYTERYIGSWPIFAINIMLLPFNSLLSDAVLRSFPASRFRALGIRICVLILTTAMCVFGFRQFGMIGAISGATLGMILERSCLFVLVLTIIGVRREDFAQLTDVPRLILATAIAFGVGYVVRYFALGLNPIVILALAGTAFVGTFIGCVLWMGLIEADEREVINARTRQYLGRDLIPG